MLVKMTILVVDKMTTLVDVRMTKIEVVKVTTFAVIKMTDLMVEIMIGNTVIQGIGISDFGFKYVLISFAHFKHFNWDSYIFVKRKRVLAMQKMLLRRFLILEKTAEE